MSLAQYRISKSSSEASRDDRSNGTRMPKLNVPRPDDGPVKDIRPTRHWACPFFKRYPDHPDLDPLCRKGRPTFHRVKEHILRKHAEPRETHHQTSDPMYKREESRSSPSRNLAFNEECREELAIKSKRVPDNEKWERTYRLLFPDEPVPSPYLDNQDTDPKLDDFLHFAELATLSDVPWCWQCGANSRTTFLNTLKHLVDRFQGRQDTYSQPWKDPDIDMPLEQNVPVPALSNSSSDIRSDTYPHEDYRVPFYTTPSTNPLKDQHRLSSESNRSEETMFDNQTFELADEGSMAYDYQGSFVPPLPGSMPPATSYFDNNGLNYPSAVTEADDYYHNTADSGGVVDDMNYASKQDSNSAIGSSGSGRMTETIDQTQRIPQSDIMYKREEHHDYYQSTSSRPPKRSRVTGNDMAMRVAIDITPSSTQVPYSTGLPSPTSTIESYHGTSSMGTVTFAADDPMNLQYMNPQLLAIQ